MAVNANRPDRWKADVAESVDTYNSWFMRFAPKTYRDARKIAIKEVSSTLALTNNLKDISPALLKNNPSILPILRMCTAPPLARDRLIGLARVPPNLVRSMEKNKKVPPKMNSLEVELKKMGRLIQRIVDKDIFTWLDDSGKNPSSEEISRASTIIADRRCGAESDPIIRNAQEKRLLELVGGWLDNRHYKETVTKGLKFDTMIPGTYAFHLNIPVRLSTGENQIKIPVDIAIMPKNAKSGDYPLLVEAKSAGDYTNTNKRRKEELTKMVQLKATYGQSIRFILLLSGYFNAGYLGYEASDGFDWVWAHRIDDLSELGV